MTDEPETAGAESADPGALGSFTPYLHRDIERRFAALQLAHDTSDTAKTVVARATDYLAFLDGETKEKTIA